MKTVNIHQAKTHLSHIIKEIESGETYLLCRNGVPVAQIDQYRRKKRTDPDPVLSKITINYDPTETLDADEWGDID